MSAIHMDGFDHYGTGTISTSNMQAGPYASMHATCGVPPWGPPRTGSACMVFAANVSNISVNRRVLPNPGHHFFFSFGFAVDQLLAGTNQIIGWFDGSLNRLYTLEFTSTGALLLRDGSNTVLAQTAGPVIVTQNWHFFEMEINTTTGVFTLRVDDTQATEDPILTASGLTGIIAQYGLLSGNTGSDFSTTYYIDDLFVRDGNGTTNNSYLGDRRVATLYANEDTTTAGWSPNYYKHFGAGICVFASVAAGTTAIQNPFANIITNPATALDIGSSDFTLETFIRWEQLPSAGNYSTIFNRWSTSLTGGLSYRLILGSAAFNGGCLQFDTSTDGTGATVATKIKFPWTPVTDTWYHLALCRTAGQLLLFVNGQQFGLPITDGDTYHASSPSMFAVGAEYPFNSPFNFPVANTAVCGHMDETRFTNGVGRYTASFTPPTAIFPRGSTSDPDWSQVSLLMGYDSGVLDESSFNRTLFAQSGAASVLPADGPGIGAFSTINKAIPDDNTFIQAALTSASNILTMTSQPSNNTTVTVGTKNGSTAAVYTFKTAISAAFDVLIDTSAQNTLTNLLNAINLGAGIGTKFGTGTTANFDVNAITLPAGQIQVLANTAGVTGNSIASTSTSSGTWATTTLTGGADIPGPSAFKVQRPPKNTTVISAMQMNVRALKTDAGTANFRSTFIAPLGSTTAGANHPLTISGVFYPDMIETDSDTSGPITPTTVINGKLQISRIA